MIAIRQNKMNIELVILSLESLCCVCSSLSGNTYNAIDLQIDCILECFFDVLVVAFSTDEN